jgi:hypothetical protein
MLDKFLAGKNVKVNGEIVGRRHILRTLHLISKILLRTRYFSIL